MFGNDPLLTNVLEHSFSMTAVEIIKFPYTLIRIKSFAFQDCKNLRKVIFQDGSYLEEIGKSAFIGCDLLEKVFIPKNCIVRIYGTIFDFNGYIPQKELVEFLRTGIMPSLLIKYTKKEKDRREKEAKKKAEAKKYKINGKGTPLGQIPSANDSKGRHYHWYNTKK